MYFMDQRKLRPLGSLRGALKYEVGCKNIYAKTMDLNNMILTIIYIYIYILYYHYDYNYIEIKMRSLKKNDYIIKRRENQYKKGIRQYYFTTKLDFLTLAQIRRSAG